MLKKYIILMVAGIIGLSSCQDELLDKNNPAAISSTDVWKDPKLIAFYVNGLYDKVPGWDYNTYNNIADEARSNYPGGPNSIFIGQWNETSNPMDTWSGNYANIRIANDFFANIAGSPADESIKKQLTAEVRFLRALFYFDLVKRYGGVPLIKASQKIDDDLLVPRNTSDECFNFMISELDLAVADLPLNATRGKVTQGAALSLKARALLYYASPFFNSTNDLTRWQKAADAAKAVIDLNKYDLYPDLKRIWLDNSAAHTEVIFEKQYALPNRSHGWDAGVKPVWLANGDAGQCSPLQELVDAFPMKNGKLPSQADSGFNPADPYVNRDNRFYAFIGYNGAAISGAPGGKLNKNYKLRIFKGGRDYDSIPAYSVYNTVSSYYTIKATNPDNSVYQYGYGSEQPWIEFRYAEILLNYIEALNEAVATPNAEIYTLLNRIRTRAGITTPLTAGSLTQAQMRELIRNERYVEMCFEGKRYWDLRRWKIAHTVLNGKKFHGAFITKISEGNFTYDLTNVVDAGAGVFENPKMYLFPIPKAEITKNPNMVQNPGWAN